MTNRDLIQSIVVDEEVFTPKTIQEMSVQDVKMLISFISSERCLRKIQSIRKDCDITNAYINNLISKI